MTFSVTFNRLRTGALLLLLVGLILPLPTHGDNADCSGSAHLTLGGVARVAYGQTVPAMLREYPGLAAHIVGSAPQGTPLTVLRGPVCSENARWWQVRTLSGAAGWTLDSAAGENQTLESWQILVDTIQRSANGFDITRVNDHGLMRALTTFPIDYIAGTVHSIFPPHESAPLDSAFDADLKNCPDQLQHSDPLYADLMPPGESPADFMAASAYLSPDAMRLIVVHHLWRTLIRCDGSYTPVYGIERVGLVSSDGEETLFDVPANADIPGTSHSVGAFNRVAEVHWAPDNHAVVIWLRYGDHMRTVLYDVDSKSVRMYENGMYPMWTPDSARLAWLYDDNGLTTLVSAAPDGSARQTLSLPNTLQVVNAPLAPIWNADGSWLLACDRVSNCAQVSPIDIDGRRALPALSVPLRDPMLARWVLADRALLWLPRSGGGIAIQPINGDAVRQISVVLAANERISDAAAFPGGQAALLTVQSSTHGARYLVLNLQTGSLTGVVLPG